MPDDAGARYVAAEAAQAAAVAQYQVVPAAAGTIGAQVRSMIATDGDYLLETVVRTRRDQLMDQAHAAVENIDPAQLLQPAAPAAEGAGDLTRAYRALTEVHAQLEQVRRAHAELLRVAQGTADQIIPNVGVTL